MVFFSTSTQVAEKAVTPSNKYWRVQCEKKCGKDFITKQEMESHLQTQCPHSNLPCTYREIGCSFKGTLDERNHHCVSNIQNHLKYAMELIAALKENKMNAKRGQQNQEDKKDNEDDEEDEDEEKEEDKEQEVKEDVKDNGEVGEDSKKNQEEENKKEEDRHTELKTLGIIIDNYITESRCEMLDRAALQQTNSLEEKLKLHQILFSEKIRNLRKTLKQYVDRAITDIQNPKNIDNQKRKSCNEPPYINSTLLTHGKSPPSSSSEEEEAEALTRAHIRSVTKKFGIHLWTIHNYKNLLGECRKSNARIYGNPFYTSERGYRVRVYVCLNGSRGGQGTHLAAYFQILKGDNDDELSWPFTLKHSITLLNCHDETLHRHHVTDACSTSADFQELHYNRPTKGSNFGCGKGAFVSHVDIENEGFLYKDAIYIMCEIG